MQAIRHIKLAVYDLGSMEFLAGGLQITKSAIWYVASIIGVLGCLTNGDVCLGASKGVSSSPNLLRNATFSQRTNPPIPDYWDLHHAAALAFPDLYKQYFVDDGRESPVHGAYVLKIVNSLENFPYVILMPRRFYNRIPGGYYTFSVYVRSETPGALFTAAPGWAVGGEIPIRPSSQWKRYQFTFKVPESKWETLQPILKFPIKGVYYVTAPQLERGKSATEFRPADQDAVNEVNTGGKEKVLVLSGARGAYGANSLPSESKIGASFEYDYYTIEDHARLQVLSVYEKELKIDVACSGYDGRDSPAIKISNQNLPPLATTEIDLPISQLAAGRFNCKAIAYMNGKTEATATAWLRKRDSNSIEVKINQHRHYLVTNNKPFYVIGITAGMGASLPDWYFDDIRGRGINTLIYNGLRSSEGGFDVENIKSLVRRAERHDLKIIVGLPLAGAKPDDWRPRMRAFYELIASLKDEPGVIGWYPVDEPGAPTWDDNDLLEIYKTLKMLDPYRLVFINWAYDGIPMEIGAQPRGTLKATDVYSVDYYPFSGERKSMAGYTNTTLRVLETARLENKISHSWLQLFGGMRAWREPTGDELNYMAYLNFVFGGMVSYFDTKSNSPETWERIKEIDSQGIELSKTLFLAGDAEQISSPVADTNFVYSVWSKRSNIYVIVVNRTASFNTFYYSPRDQATGSCAKSARIIFANRTLELVAGQIQEEFPPYASRVYELRCGQLSEKH